LNDITQLLLNLQGGAGRDRDRDGKRAGCVGGDCWELAVAPGAEESGGKSQDGGGGAI